MWGNLTKINVASHLLFFFRVHLFWRKKNNNISLGEFFNKKLCLSVNSPRKKKIWMRIFFFLSTSHKHNVSSKWAKFHIHSFMNTIIYCVTCVIANPIYFHQKFRGIFCSWFNSTEKNFWVHIAQCAFIQSKTKMCPAPRHLQPAPIPWTTFFMQTSLYHLRLLLPWLQKFRC